MSFQDLQDDLNSSSPDLANERDGAELTQRRLVKGSLWHRQQGHLNSKDIELLKNMDTNWVLFDGTVSGNEVSAVGKSCQSAYPKVTDHKIKLLLLPVFEDTHLQRRSSATSTVTKLSDEYTKWEATYLMKSKHDVIGSLKAFVQSVVILGGFRV